MFPSNCRKRVSCRAAVGVILGAWALPAAAAVNVTFEKLARTGDPVPGREHLNVVFNGRAFQRYTPGVFSRPCINDAGQAVFMARSTVPGNFNGLSTIGIYLKTPGSPLQLIVDQSDNTAWNIASVGAPFPVPGRAADAVFTGGFANSAPVINNRGDVLFHATLYSPTEGSGSGFYVYRAADQQIIQVVDTFDEIPGHPGETFAGFSFGGTFQRFMLASLNDNGDVVFMGRFWLPGEQYEDQGLYGTSIDGTPLSGGPIVRLADSTETAFPASEPYPYRGLSHGNQPAINNQGTVIFQAAIGNPPPSGVLDGIFTIPVDGSAGATTIARRGQVTPPLSDGNVWAYYSTFGGHDINDAGQFTFHHSFYRSSWDPYREVIFTGDLAALGDPLSVVVDTLGGYSVPGQPAGTNFSGLAIAPINESGQMGFLAHDNGPISNAHGIYTADLAGTAFEAVSHNKDVPPGRVAPAELTNFGGRSAAVNDLGNLAMAPTGADFSKSPPALFGLYFFDRCTGTLERIVDDQTSAPAPPVGLGGQWGSSGERALTIHDGHEARSGHFRSFNNSNDIALFAAFSTFDVGVYIAHVETGGGAGGVDITCPADVTVECGGPTAPADTGEATAADGCSGAAVATTYSDVGATACGATTTITRTWTADDGSGGFVSCDQIITVHDTAAPSLALPADAAIACDASADPSNTGQATAADACDAAPSLTYSDSIVAGACGQERTITRTWTATDACGNGTVAVQTITVTDTAAPALTVPADITLACDESTDASRAGQATAADACDPAPTVTSTDMVTAGACANESVVTRTWTAADACGNTVSVDQIITVDDAVAPVLSLPLDATVECDADSSPAATGSATASDACDTAPVVSSSDSAASGACPQASLITRTWNAADTCGNSASADQTVSVVDTTAPVIALIGPGTMVLDGCTGAAYVEQGATATDNCDAAGTPVTIGGDAVDTAFLGTYVVTYDAQDACGNAAARVARTVEVVDATAPTFTSLPADLTVECEGPDGAPATRADIAAFLGMAAATDACDPIVGITHDAPATLPFGDTLVTWTATDATGNLLTDSRLVTVVDTTAPASTCPAAVSASADAACQAGIPDLTGGVTASDTCTDALDLAIAQTPAATTVVGLGSHAVSLTVSDGSGNSSQCATTLTVVDDSAPTLTLPFDAAVECDQSTAPANTGQAVAADNCDSAPGITFTDSAAAGTCPQLSVITRTWTATDASGTAASGEQFIEVVDTTSPSVACPGDLAVSGGFGGAVVTFEPTAADACDPSPTVTAAPPSGSFFATGLTSVSATASDACDNASAPCAFDVLVSCFGVNRAKIGTKDIACRGIEEIEFTSMNGTEELISLFKAEEGEGGSEEDTLPPSIIVDDGVNGPVTVDTSCSQAIEIGDVFGPYTVTDLKKDHHDNDEAEGNEVELRGTFVSAVPFDLALDDLEFTIDDGLGHVASFLIPAGSFEVDGNPEKQKFKFEGAIAGMQVKAKFEGCKFKLKIKDATNTGQLAGTAMTARLTVGPNVGEETIVMEDKHNHLKFKRDPKVNCCPECEGVASMQVTSDQGVLVFEPPPGQSKLPANTVVDDGVNGAVTIHTSCSQPLNAGDVSGPYTVSEVIKIYED